MTTADGLQRALERLQGATNDFLNGSSESSKAMAWRADDATIFGGWGGYERGRDQVGPRYDWAAARFAAGRVDVEEIARHESGDLAYTVHLERSSVRLAGAESTVPMALRVTHIYRREDGERKLAHRHADPIAAVQAPESVLQR